MPRITFLPGNLVCEVEKGVPLQMAAEKASLTLSYPCAGKGVCGKCLIKVESGAVAFEDNGKVPAELLRQGYVLACRSTVLEDADILASSLGDERGQFSDALSRMAVDDALFPQPADVRPLVMSERVNVAVAAQGDGLGDYDRFAQAVKQRFMADSIDLPLPLLRKLPDALRQNNGEVFIWYMRRHNTIYIVDISSEKPNGNYGAAIDIGTTTVAIQLVDIDGAKAIDATTLYNLQLDRGIDVISRIGYAKNPERIEELRTLVISTINKGIADLCERNGNIQRGSVHNASIAGNTTMTQLFMGINPEFIRLEPYTPAVMGAPLYTAASLGLEINPCAYVWIAPNVGSYVGGDIMSGILCTDFAVGAEDICLFIDIGTNGEIVLGNSEFLLGCACSAGPAFEGGGVERGMRASNGAIDHVDVDPQSGKCRYSVIGGGRALGICGSGMISLLAQLLNAGIIDQRGKLDRSGKYSSIQSDRKKSKYFITDGGENSPDVYITENDIDNFIRAKAAIFSACVTLLKSVELTFDDVSKFYIAGGFGRYIEIDKAQTLGLLPPLDQDRFMYIGNSSLTGAFMSLLSEKHREKEMELANRVTYVDLSVEAGYMDEYVAAMFLPHTDMSIFRRRNEMSYAAGN